MTVSKPEAFFTFRAVFFLGCFWSKKKGLFTIGEHLATLAAEWVQQTRGVQQKSAGRADFHLSEQRRYACLDAGASRRVVLAAMGDIWRMG